MFEARILQGSLLKKIIEAIRELVTDANLDCDENQITMQVLYKILNPPIVTESRAVKLF
jgi:Proliferating cell nuclear antigen, N-terminal domain